MKESSGKISINIVLSQELTTGRKHMVAKGRRRDTAWFSITDDEWPVAKAGLETWLSEDNFDENGKQRKGLKQCREAVEA